jgi:anti-sigma B factor antagonist
MVSVDLGTRECGGRVVVALGGELDIADAVSVTAVVAARTPEVIVDLAALEFIDSGGVAALAREPKQARHAGGNLLLATPAAGPAGPDPHPADRCLPCPCQRGRGSRERWTAAADSRAAARKSHLPRRDMTSGQVLRVKAKELQLPEGRGVPGNGREGPRSPGTLNAI